MSRSDGDGFDNIAVDAMELAPMFFAPFSYPDIWASPNASCDFYISPLLFSRRGLSGGLFNSPCHYVTSCFGKGGKRSRGIYRTIVDLNIIILKKPF